MDSDSKWHIVQPDPCCCSGYQGCLWYSVWLRSVGITGFSIVFSVRVDRCVRCGYAWCRIVVAASRACVPACTPMSCVPVCDADALDTCIHARGCVHAGAGRCVRVHSGAPLWGVASLLQRSIRLEKFLLKTNDPYSLFGNREHSIIRIRKRLLYKTSTSPCNTLVLQLCTIPTPKVTVVYPAT